MKVWIVRDESYPVYFMHTKKEELISDNELGYEIPDDKVKWIEQIRNEYLKVQDYLEEVYYHGIKND